METSKLKKFAQYARRNLVDQVSNKLKLVLATDGTAGRENPQAVKKLEEQIKAHGKKQVIEQVAYTWFNRFSALRFMDVNSYTRIGVVSPSAGGFQPEILAEAKMGHIDEKVVSQKTRQKIVALLDGSAFSNDAQAEAYQLLVVATCNNYYKTMPFLFERIADYTELLMPDDLLSGNSILAYTREAMTPDVCQDVEVIGWLYQFYISEKKDDVFAALKKGKKITPENIPAATQLFTPHWIVRYLVENSLGRLWLLNHPDSGLIGQMDYYINPEGPETDFLQISSPEEIKICDPACGSGHMLTYAFDLLYAIYEEQGYQATDIPRLILTHNLYGIEIDQRAGALAAFALTMKARGKYRRFLSSDKVVQPNICVLENIHIEPDALSDYMDMVGRDLFTGGIQGVVNQFEEADNFGSLIRPLVTNVRDVLEILGERQMGEDLFLAGVHQNVLKALRQADYLSPKYHVVVANPPYMNSGGMNQHLKETLKSSFKEAKADLMTCFMDRAGELSMPRGLWGMINLPSWLFLSSFEAFRKKLVENHCVNSLLHLGRGIFGSDFGSVAFVLANIEPTSSTVGVYRRLFERHVEVRTVGEIQRLFFESEYQRYVYRQSNLSKLPGTPIAYWVSERVRDIFENSPPLKDVLQPKQGTSTGDDETYVRFWFEINKNEFGLGFASLESARASGFKYFPLDKGGEFRKWFGNNEKVLRFDDQSFEELRAIGNHLPSRNMYFKRGLTWSKITSGNMSVRYDDAGFIFSSVGLKGFPSEKQMYFVLGYMNSQVVLAFSKIISPTISIISGDIERLPYKDVAEKDVAVSESVRALVNLSKSDWDAFEGSWDFTFNPLVAHRKQEATNGLSDCYSSLRAFWNDNTTQSLRLEKENNQNFIQAYALEDELSPNVSTHEVSLSCNPAYRYDEDKSESELEAFLLADTMREFISYSVGCMLGRYSLDKPGLILANQGETADDYRQQIPGPTFAPDEDNVIPLLDGDWFEDDITERFKAFLKVIFGTEHFEENLTFLENALYPENVEGKKRKDIRYYFLKEFYKHHVKLYKKRPIYWMFSSPKGTFNALIYMHGYRPDTISVILNDYLREFSAKLAVQKNQLEGTSISTSASQSEKTKALKEIDKLNKMITELAEYERDVLYPLATNQIEIDLDDGVKVNYPKFGAALKKVVGLN